jgi:2'-5' RNA ligase
VAALAAAARRVLATETAFSVVASGLGGFPSARRAEVVWIGFEDRGRGLAALAAALEDAVAPLVGPATRPFRPHLTVARSRPPLRLAPPATAIDPVVLPVREVRLMESHLHRSGARYDTLDTIALGDGLASEHLFG